VHGEVEFMQTCQWWPWAAWWYIFCGVIILDLADPLLPRSGEASALFFRFVFNKIDSE